MLRYSIIIPVYAAEPYIDRCIDGLLSQDADDDFEILFIDNNSPDKAASIIERRAKGDARIRLLHEPKQGAYAARNLGLREARGRIMVFTDPDCVAEPDWLRRLGERFEDERVQVVVGRTEPNNPPRTLALLDAYEHHKNIYILGGDDPSAYCGHTNNQAARREAFDRVGEFVERKRGADTIFVRRIVDAAGCDAAVYEPRARVLHLEVETLRAYFRKISIYGRSREQYAKITPARALTTGERLRVFADTRRGERLSVMSSIALFALLVAGVGFWYAGAIAAKLRREPLSSPQSLTPVSE